MSLQILLKQDATAIANLHVQQTVIRVAKGSAQIIAPKAVQLVTVPEGAKADVRRDVEPIAKTTVQTATMLNVMKKDYLSRRKFFKVSTTKILPILTLVALSSPQIISQTLSSKKLPVTGCSSCSGCGHGCAHSCGNDCKGSCHKSCEYTCTGGCGSNCMGNCKGDCMGGCNTSCQGSCQTSCQGSCEKSCVNGCQNTSR